MKYDLVIFDLDGTLLHTLPDIAEAARQALGNAGLPQHDMEAVRHSIGGGVGNLIRQLVPAGTPESVRAAVLADFRAIYGENADVCTAPFPGVPELLRALRAAGVRVAANSNKVDDAVQRLCRAHFDGLVELAQGELPGVPKKPRPDGALAIMKALNAAPGRTLYVGDGDSDILTARNAGVDCAWVSWGYRRRAELGDLEVSHAFDTAEALGSFILEA